MKTLLTKLYYDFPIHFYSYEVDSDLLKLAFLNEKEVHITKISVKINQKQMDFDLDTHDKIIDVDVEMQNSNIMSKPSLISCQVDSKVYILADFTDYLTITQPKSVFSLGIERYLYKQRVAKSLHIHQEDVKYIASKNEFYWSCTCGQSNFLSSKSCRNCGNSAEKLFATELNTQLDAIETELEMKYNVNVLIWSMLAYFFHIAVQVFFGDFLFQNNVKNEFFGVFNRLLLPMVIFLATIGIIYAHSRYKMKTVYALKVFRLLSIVYLNVILGLFFVLTAYNFVFVVLLDFVIFSYVFIKTRKSYGRVYEFISIGITCAFLVLASFQLSKFSQYDMIIQPDGLFLTIETDQTVYVIPEKIDNIKVFEVFFSLDHDYQITDLTVSKNLQFFDIYSTGVLPNLEIFRIQDGNTFFTIEDNILYNADGTVRLVPMVVEEIYIDSEVITEGSLRDNYNLKTLVIGKHVKTIEKDAFANTTSLTTLTFEADSTLEFIGRNAFYNSSSLTSVEVPISVESMGLGVFEGCDSLTSLTMPFLGEEREYTNVLADSHDVLTYQFGSRTYLDDQLIPESLTYLEVYDIDRIHNVTFYRARNIEEIVLSGNFIYMGIRSFYDCESLRSFIIPSGIEVIPLSAFENCYELDNLVIPASVTEIADNAFLNCGLANVTYLGDINDLQISPTGNDSLLTALGLS